MKSWKTITLTAMSAVLVFSATALMAPQTPQAQAEEIARRDLPAGSVLVKSEFDDGLYEFKFVNESEKKVYSYEIDPATQKVVEEKVKRIGAAGGFNVKLTMEEAKEKVLQMYPGANVFSVSLDMEDGLHVYEVKFSEDALRGEVELNAETGEWLERKAVHAPYSHGK